MWFPKFQRAIELSKAIAALTESVLFCVFEKVGITVRSSGDKVRGRCWRRELDQLKPGHKNFSDTSKFVGRFAHYVCKGTASRRTGSILCAVT